jgi:hypothetical protein
MSPVDAERARLKRAWPCEFDDAARCSFLGRFDGPRERGGYPAAFRRWPIDRRNAWFAGFNQGLCDRRRLVREGADG